MQSGNFQFALLAESPTIGIIVYYNVENVDQQGQKTPTVYFVPCHNAKMQDGCLHSPGKNIPYSVWDY